MQRSQIIKEEQQHLKKNGDAIVVEVYTSFLKIESKPVYQIIIVDITDKVIDRKKFIPGKKRYKALKLETQKDVIEIKKPENNLLEPEILKSAILDSSLDAITIDTTDMVIEWNLAAERIFGYSREEAIGQKMANLIIPERFRVHHLRGMAHFLKTNDGPVLRKQIEIPAIRKDGIEFPSELYISPINIDGRILFTGTLRDITERKQAQKNLFESEKRFRDVADSAPVMIWMSDAKNETVYVNKPWIEFTGLNAEMLAGKTWTSIVHADDVTLAIEKFADCFKNLEPVTMTYRLKRQTGEYRWVLDTGIPRKLSDGSFLGYIGSVVEINDQKLKEDQLQYPGDYS